MNRRDKPSAPFIALIVGVCLIPILIVIVIGISLVIALPGPKDATGFHDPRYSDDIQILDRVAREQLGANSVTITEKEIMDDGTNRVWAKVRIPGQRREKTIFLVHYPEDGEGIRAVVDYTDGGQIWYGK